MAKPVPAATHAIMAWYEANSSAGDFLGCKVVVFSLGIEALTLCRLRLLGLELPIDAEQGHQVL